MNNKNRVAGKKRWEGVSKEEKSKQMKKVRGSFDMSKIKLKWEPKDIKKEKLTEIANNTDKGLELAVLLALSDRKARTEKEIQKLSNAIAMVAAIELLRRDGLMEVSENFSWFTPWSVKQKGMICPNCSHTWKFRKDEEKIGKCPKCGLDILKAAEQIMGK